MINILCYGDSHTWGNIAGSRNKDFMLAKRFDRDTRWTGVLQKLLGDNFHVIEAGLNGRNTSFDETGIVRPSRNGLATFPLILEMNYPLDLVILMLGTNDSRIDFNASLEQIILAMQKMIRYVKESHLGPDFNAPQILLMSPAPIQKIDVEDFNLLFDETSITKTQQLEKHYRELADQENCLFLDAGKFIEISEVDGVHFGPDSHRNLAQAIALKIKEVFT